VETKIQKNDLLEGDCTTKYFMVKVSGRKCKNKDVFGLLPNHGLPNCLS
jgi:hypothetical protein